MPWLVMFFALQSGLIAQDWSIVGDGGAIHWQTAPNTLEATLDVRAVAFDHLELRGFVESYQFPSGGQAPFFTPYRIDYGMSVSLIWGPVRVGATHSCFHPVGSPGIGSPAIWSDSSELFVRLETKVNF